MIKLLNYCCEGNKQVSATESTRIFSSLEIHISKRIMLAFVCLENSPE